MGRLSEQLVRKALPPVRGQLVLWDDGVRGFGLRVTPGGAKSFILDYRADQRQRRITIGSHPDWTVAAARDVARDLKRDIDLGKDPMGERRDERDAPTINDLWERYEKEHLVQKSERSRADEKSMWENIIIPRFNKTKISAITHSAIDAFHRDITTIRGTPVRANRVIEVMRKAFNLAIRWRWLKDNPASGVRRNPEEKRNRYLNKTEIAALVLALNSHPQRTSANAIKLLMLTGARKSEVLNATWDMFDLENGIWTKPSSHTKQRKLHRVPLGGHALNLLIDIKCQADEEFQKSLQCNQTAIRSPFVFPGESKQPMQEIRRSWVAVCKMAGLTRQIPKKNKQGKIVKNDKGEPVMTDWPNVRLHDLRHSFASILVSSGASLPLIGQMLGHTQVQTTQRYAHLYDDPLRKAAEMVGQTMQIGVNNSLSTAQEHHERQLD